MAKNNIEVNNQGTLRFDFDKFPSPRNSSDANSSTGFTSNNRYDVFNNYLTNYSPPASRELRTYAGVAGSPPTSSLGAAKAGSGLGGGIARSSGSSPAGAGGGAETSGVPRIRRNKGFVERNEPHGRSPLSFRGNGVALGVGNVSLSCLIAEKRCMSVHHCLVLVMNTDCGRSNRDRREPLSITLQRLLRK